MCEKKDRQVATICFADRLLCCKSLFGEKGHVKDHPWNATLVFKQRGTKSQKKKQHIMIIECHNYSYLLLNRMGLLGLSLSEKNVPDRSRKGEPT